MNTKSAQKRILAFFIACVSIIMMFSSISYTFFNYTFETSKTKGKKVTYDVKKTPFGVNAKKVHDAYGNAQDNSSYNDIVASTYHDSNSWFTSYAFYSDKKNEKTALAIVLWSDKMYTKPLDMLKSFNTKYDQYTKKYGKPYIERFVNSKDISSNLRSNQRTANASNAKSIQDGAQVIVYWLDGEVVRILSTREAFKGKYCVTEGVQDAYTVPSKDNGAAAKDAFNQLTSKFTLASKIKLGTSYKDVQNNLGPAPNTLSLPSERGQSRKGIKYDISSSENLIVTFTGDKVSDINASKLIANKPTDASKWLISGINSLKSKGFTPMAVASFNQNTSALNYNSVAPLTDAKIKSYLTRDKSIIVIFDSKDLSIQLQIQMGEDAKGKENIVLVTRAMSPLKNQK